MANSITAELAALREEVATLTAAVTELLEIVRPVELEVEFEGEPGEVLPEIGADTTPVAEASGVKFVDGQLVDVPKGKGK